MKSTIHECQKRNVYNMSKKVLLIIAIAVSVVACNKTTEEVKEVKTAYIDTSELMKEYTEAKDLEAKYKARYMIGASACEKQQSNGLMLHRPTN